MWTDLLFQRNLKKKSNEGPLWLEQSKKRDRIELKFRKKGGIGSIPFKTSWNNRFVFVLSLEVKGDSFIQV